MRARALRWHAALVRRFLPAGEHDELGLTLVELLLAIAIETVLFGALAAAFISSMTGSSTVSENLARSTDARLAAAYIVSDARNSSGPELSLTDTVSCADAHPPVTGTQTPVARFAWDAPTRTGDTTANISNYVLVAGNLLRRHCEGGLMTVDTVLATNVASVTVSCSPNADCSGAPTSITVTIVETLDTSTTTAPYTYSLTAAFRQVNGGGAPLPVATPRPVVLLGGPCGGSTGVSIVGSSTMKVYGDAFINTADGSGCTAMKLDGGGSTFTAGSTNFLSGGTCSAPAYLACPPSTTYTTPIGDPYASVTPPSRTGMTNQSNSCSSYGAQTAQPGYYANPFSPGGGATCTLATGVYYLDNGLNTNNGGIIIKSAPGGVLLYVNGGAINITGGSTFTVSALSSPPTYSGIALWQATTDASAISFSGDATIVVDGALYGPKAQLVVSGGSHAPFVDVLVVRSIDLNNSGHLVVGSPSATPLSIGASGFPPSTWTVNRPYPTITLSGAGGDGNYLWSVTGMPAGM
jgi:type II secretory pathway pseudopilin PulG